ncbi:MULTISPECIES: GntR family transcriptional regulator [Citricoccus]|uniref:GntR family transcriptional regulator n=1 Tax=Citricoccus TaxID=169133 RepID=UPI000255F175|nr:GntR family transcriptional regulator [Citricoccus sp. CH26A]
MSPGPTPPEISLDLSSPVPPFEQIRSRVAALIDAGTLAPGARLPSVRSLAADLGIAVGTVARAYRELEGTGHVQSRRRHGTTVAGSPPAPPAPSQAELDGAADQFIARATAAGLGPDQVLSLVRRRLDR